MGSGVLVGQGKNIFVIRILIGKGLSTVHDCDSAVDHKQSRELTIGGIWKYNEISLTLGIKDAAD